MSERDQERGPMHGPFESAEHFLERTRAQSESPSWEQLRKRHNSADRAYEFLSSAPFHGDAEMAKVMVDAARVHAELAIHDKLEELTQTIKLCVGEMIESNAELSETMKQAANSIHAAVRQSQVKAA